MYEWDCFNFGREICQADDIQNEANELLRIRDYLFNELAQKTGQPVEKVSLPNNEINRDKGVCVTSVIVWIESLDCKFAWLTNFKERRKLSWKIISFSFRCSWSQIQLWHAALKKDVHFKQLFLCLLSVFLFHVHFLTVYLNSSQIEIVSFIE